MDNLLNEALGMAKEADRLEQLSKTYKSCFNTEAGKEVLEGEAVKDYVRKNTSRIYAEGMDAVEDMRRVSKDAEVATGKS